MAGIDDGGIETIIDADHHYLEPRDMWTNWFPARFRDRAPRLIADGKGGEAWRHPMAPGPSPIGIITTPGFSYEAMRGEGVSYEDIRPGCYDPVARLADMNSDGISAAMVSGPQNTMSHFMASPDDDYLVAGFDACNDYLIDGFCAADPQRLFALSQIPSLRMDVALRFLRRANEKGARGALLSGWPSGGVTVSEDDDPFWSAAEAIGMPLCVHVQMVSAATRRGRKDSYHGIGDAKGGTAISRGIGIGELAIVFQHLPKVINQFIFSGIFERFPALRVVLLEAGVGWIPHCLQQLDDRYWRLRSWAEPPIAEPPSFYWHRNMAANIIRDPVGLAVRHLVGIENILWSSDYPHHVTDWPRSRQVIDAAMVEVPRAERAAILAGNAKRIYCIE